jgi:hypothetical protein
MRHVRRIGLLGGFCMVASGCFSMVEVDGFRTVERYWEDTKREIPTRAAFEFNCPRENISLTLLAVDRNGFAQSVGATGCDKKAVYVSMPDGAWILNSGSEKK